MATKKRFTITQASDPGGTLPDVWIVVDHDLLRFAPFSTRSGAYLFAAGANEIGVAGSTVIWFPIAEAAPPEVIVHCNLWECGLVH